MTGRIATLGRCFLIPARVVFFISVTEYMAFSGNTVASDNGVSFICIWLDQKRDK